MSQKARSVSTSDDLKHSLQKLARQLHNQNSLPHVFVRAVVAGVGSALGASLVAGLVLVLLAQLIATIDYIPVISGIISTREIQDALRNAMQSP